ncbi:MAG TPA: S1/P1 nuclease [Fimbriimonas sp.]
MGFRCGAFSLILWALPLAAHAWSGTGHRVIVSIAERDLSPIARIETARILGVPPNSLLRGMMEASTWADENRSDESAPWHYINHHFRTDGKRTKMKPEPENVVVAIERFRKVLKDRAKPDAERRPALVYVLHFVGDAHQPLHGVARDSDRFPAGDRGGNDFGIQPPGEFAWMERPPKNLHALWDSGAGLFPSEQGGLGPVLERRIRVQADTLRAALARRSFRRLADPNPMNWSRESLDGAKRVVYRLEENAEPSAAYLAEARRLAAQRATLAGYRLADLLNRALGG